MPHIILNMDGCLDAMRGNASTGSLVTLKAAYHTLDGKLSELAPSKSLAAHALLEDIQSFLCDGGTYDGASDQVTQFTNDCNSY